MKPGIRIVIYIFKRGGSDVETRRGMSVSHCTIQRANVYDQLNLSQEGAPTGRL
jgi:hypothetical protein